MVRGKLLLMKMHLRTILQNAREATRLVVLEGGYKDFLNQLFIPDSHSLYWELWGQVGGIPRQGGHLEVEGQLPGLTCWDILASLWTAHCRGEGPQKAHSGQPPPLLLGHSVRGCACWSCTAVQFCTTKHTDADRSAPPLIFKNNPSQWRCRKQLMASALSIEKRKQARGPDVTFPQE